jgi:AraC-like DNA-binding protein
MIEISTIIELMTFGSSTMFGILFISNRFNNRKGNPFLGLFLISLGYFSLQGILYDFYEKEVFRLEVSLFFLVLLFFYLNKTISRTVKNWHYLLFLPGVLMNITTNSLVLNRIMFFHMLYEIFYLLTFLLIVYFFKILSEHELNLKEFYSSTEKKTLAWLKKLIIIIFSFHFFEFVESIIPTKRADELEFIFSILYSLFPFSLVYLIGVNAFTQSHIFEYELPCQKTKGELNENLNQLELETESRFNQLEKTIVKEKLFTQQTLTLRDLSLSLNIKERNLSILIKSNTGDSFYAYINRLRIEEFKHLLTQPEYQKFSLFGLAQKVGFSSKSTFYKAFQEIENKTPKSYLVGLKSSSNLKRTHSI